MVFKLCLPSPDHDQPRRNPQLAVGRDKPSLQFLVLGKRNGGSGTEEDMVDHPEPHYPPLTSLRSVPRVPYSFYMEYHGSVYHTTHR